MTLIAIGIKAAPKEILYVVIKKTEARLDLLTPSKLIVPVSLTVPEKLSFIRKAFKDIIAEFQCNRAGIRVTEDLADPNPDRLSYEAVIQELIASSSVEKYLIGKISTMCSRLGIERDAYKPMVKQGATIEPIAGFNTFNAGCKEAILVGLASLAL
ncbi:hypothetical protein [Hymenobacter convexus]|uniref:hypothetical protein n=1 Tax=Hymenobacter sp. CA1UV-4 TaxID=3063782 RepID=UPI0027138359|nr:hypothetical protein [Hymenobacter sp. CA1UV-4]MDO7850388.1 hypothetical protein [Hymenobacter sp. CA1UV-4]